MSLAKYLRAAVALAFLSAGAPVLFAGAAAAPAAATTLATPPAMPAVAPAERLPAVFDKAAPADIADLRAIEARVESVVARVAQAVVSVSVSTGGSLAMGSAVIISPDGLMLCAAHVTESPGRMVTITFPDGKTARGITMGTNHEADASMLRITDPGPWPYVPIGEVDKARLGDWVIALGHPAGFDARRPIVARLGRLIRSGEIFQTDCTLLGGDSGGPLFDMSGRVIAIHTAISESAESNYHVPISIFANTWTRLASNQTWGNQRISRGSYVGATGVDHPDGVRIDSVAPNSPAVQAGVQAGDIVRKINDQPIRNSQDFRETVMGLSANTAARFEIARGAAVLTITVTPTRTGRGGRGGGGGGGGGGRGGRGTPQPAPEAPAPIPMPEGTP